MTAQDSVDNLKRLVGRLAQVGDKLVAALNQRSDRESHRVMIMIGWAAKTSKMLKSLLSEANGPAPENSLIQARVLLEILVNFEYFAKEFEKDAEGTVRRFWDGMAVQMGKKFRIMGDHPEAAGLSQEVRQEVVKAQADAAARIGNKEDVKAVERHGFYSENIATRCDKMDRKRHYDLLYRQFCDPVHGSDILDCAVMVVRPEEAAKIVRDLIPPALAVGYDAGVVVFTIVDVVCGNPVTTDLEGIKEEARSLERPDLECS